MWCRYYLYWYWPRWARAFFGAAGGFSWSKTIQLWDLWVSEDHQTKKQIRARECCIIKGAFSKRYKKVASSSSIAPVRRNKCNEPDFQPPQAEVGVLPPQLQDDCNVGFRCDSVCKILRLIFCVLSSHLIKNEFPSKICKCRCHKLLSHDLTPTALGDCQQFTEAPTTIHTAELGQLSSGLPISPNNSACWSKLLPPQWRWAVSREP